MSRSLSWLVVLGSLLVLAGLVGLVYVGVATLTSVLLFGWLLLFGGVVALVHALASLHSRYVWLGLVIAALNIAAGLILILHPEVSAAGLTLFAGLLFLSGGMFRLFGGLAVRGGEMIWSMVQGAFGILLGILVLAEWPDSTRYVLGTFFSLALLFDGLGLIATGMGGRQLVRMVTPGEGEQGGAAGEGAQGRGAAPGAGRAGERGAGETGQPPPDGRS
ncbi:DUF308 domain-containing protein [Streptomyces sp. YIM 98790]|uniref:HdeD family acid-resistance protein n=1 Tax=Streptomyces sp. YIM 98790 TaxID=2689077 RepID=UPI0028BF11BA|nr:DUF308 domain-containing protein [Streptomyces sp. YIM 98790]